MATQERVQNRASVLDGAQRETLTPERSYIGNHILVANLVQVSLRAHFQETGQLETVI